MTARKRCLRLPARLNLERLEDIEAAGSLLSVTAASLADTAIVRAAEQLSKTPDVERPSTVADAAMDSPTEEAQALSVRIFGEDAAQPSSSEDYSRNQAATDESASSDAAEPKHAANDPPLDAVMAADNALVDPASHPDAASVDSAKSGTDHARTPAGNSTPPNLAGAYTGAGQGPGGASTPFAGGGGGGGGWGAGPGVTNANQLSSANLNMAGGPTTNTAPATGVATPAPAALSPSLLSTTFAAAASVTPVLPAVGTPPGVMPTVGSTADNGTSSGSGSGNPGVNLLSGDSGQQIKQIYDTAGSFTFVVPNNVHSVSVQIWGAGGGGGGGFGNISSRGTIPGGNGGGGGCYVTTGSISVVPEDSYTVNVGTGGAGGNAGQNGVNGGDS